MNAKIIDRGRGPEIAGTRITVYDIWEYARAGHHHSFIAVVLGVSSPQVLSALEYIEQHKEEVLADYQNILDRIAKGHPPEVQAKVDAIHAKYANLWQDRRKKALENGDASDHGGQ
jgi:uncharacterized protein (DUF433 family)